MNPTHTPDDDWLEDALRRDARDRRAGHIDDGGFTARVMAALPEPFAAPRWRKPVEWVLWGMAGTAVAASLPAVATDLAREMFRLIAAQPISLPHIATALVAIGVATWGGAAYVLRRD